MPKKVSKFPPKKPDKSHIYIPSPKLNWSEYQKDVFRSIAKDSGHLIVDALAGSSKTTTAIESFKYVPKAKKILALAFNKIIQEELRSRSPSYVQCLTFHSLGLMAIKQRFGSIEIDDNKVFDLVKDQIGNSEFDLIINICDTVAFCKYSLQDLPSQIETIIYDFGIDLCEMEIKQFIAIVIKTLALDKAQTNKIDFNDMCYFPFVYNLSLGSYDYVYVDEVQDLNKSQLVMAKKACKPDGRIILIGDKYQALYSWRMADTSILEGIKELPNTKTLELPISYRCPKAIIDLAKNWVPNIACPGSAIDGEINDIHLNELYNLAKPGCFILSRTNAPLIKICMSFIKLGIKANIKGRDVGKQLSYLIKKSKKKKIDQFLKWLDNWKDEEVKKLNLKRIKTDNLLDRVECLYNVCEGCSSLEEAVKKIDNLFNDTDEKNIIILSSVHRAKGLERDDIFLLRWTFGVWFDHMQWVEKPNEEANIAYVAVTRCKKKLFIVNKEPS